MSSTQPNNGNEHLLSTHEKCQKMDETPITNTFIQSFIKAKKDLLLYPASNPVVTESIEHLLQLLREVFKNDEAIRLHIEKDGLFVNNEGEIHNGSVIGGLSLSLYRRGIREIIIDPNIPFDEMRAFLEVLNMKVEEIAQAGGIEDLITRKDINHANVKGTGELAIIDGTDLMISENVLPELEGLEDIESDIEELSSPDIFTDTFVRVQEGNVASLNRLRTLLEKPDLFSKLLERFSLRLEKMEGEIDSAMRMERMLEALHVVGAAIASLPSEDERVELMGNLAFSVLGLSVNLREDLVNRGLVPNLALSTVESAILSRFPVSRLADALTRNFEVSGAAASVMRSYFSNLDFTQINSSALSETLRFCLKEKELLSPEIEALLTEEGSKLDITRPVSVPEDSKPDDVGPTSAHHAPVVQAVSRIEAYPSEKILFHEGEQKHLLREVTEELTPPGAEGMANTILELLRYEETSVNHAALVGRVRSYIEHFLRSGKYKDAAKLIKGLQSEAEQKARIFSSAQLKPLQDAANEFLGEKRILELIDKFKDIKRKSPDFEEIVSYLDDLGQPAIQALLHALENEESRHVRLLICHALARTDVTGIAAVAGKIKHPLWYVARNAVSILGQIGRPECVPYLEQALEHEEARVQKEAVKSLAGIKSDRAIQLICSCVDREDAGVRRAALGWVLALGVQQALPALERILDADRILKQDDDVLRLSIEALENIEGDASTALLERLSKTRRLFRWRKAALIRHTASAVLDRAAGE